MPTMQRNPAGGVIDPRNFGRGAGTVRPPMPVQGFQYGGQVYNDEEDIEGQGYDDAMLDPMQFVQGALNYGKKKYGIPIGDEQEMGFDDGGVVPTMATEGEDPGVTGGGNPNAVDPRQAMAYLTGDGAVSPEIAQALEQRVDPNGSLDPTARAMAAIQAAPSDEARFGMLQHYRTKYNAFTGAARAALSKGDMGSAAHYASLAMDAVPDGKRTQFAPAQGGLAMLSKPTGQPQPRQQSFARGGYVQSFQDGSEVEEDEEVLSHMQPEPQADPPDVAADAPDVTVPEQEPLTGPQATMPAQTEVRPEVIAAAEAVKLLEKGFDDQLKDEGYAAKLAATQRKMPVHALDEADAQRNAQLQGWGSAAEKAGGVQLAVPSKSIFDSRQWVKDARNLFGSAEPPAPTTGSEAATRTSEDVDGVPTAAPAAAPAAPAAPARRAPRPVVGSLSEPTRPSQQGVVPTRSSRLSDEDKAGFPTPVSHTPSSQVHYVRGQRYVFDGKTWIRGENSELVGYGPSVGGRPTPYRRKAGSDGYDYDGRAIPAAQPAPPMRMGTTDRANARRGMVNAPTYHPSGFDPNGAPAYGSQRVRGYGPGLREQTGDPAFMDPKFKYPGSQPVFPTTTSGRVIPAEEAVRARAAAPDIGAPPGDRYGPGTPTARMDRLGGTRGGRPIAGDASGMGSGGGRGGVIPASGRGADTEESQYDRAMQRIEDEAARRYPSARQQGDREAFIEKRTAEYEKTHREFGKEELRIDREDVRQRGQMDKQEQINIRAGQRQETDLAAREKRAADLAQANLTRDEAKAAAKMRETVVRSKLAAAGAIERDQLKYLATMIRNDPSLQRDPGRLKNLAAPIMSALKLRPDELLKAVEIAATYDATSGTYDPKYGTGYGGPGGAAPAGGGAPEGKYPEGIEVGTPVPYNHKGKPVTYKLGTDGKTMWREDKWR